MMRSRARRSIRQTEEDRWIGRMEDLRRRGPRRSYEDLTSKLGIRYAPTSYAGERDARKLWRHAYRLLRKRAMSHARSR